MQHPVRLSLSLAGTAALALASIPLGIRSAAAQEAKTTQGTAADLGVMSCCYKALTMKVYGDDGYQPRSTSTMHFKLTP